MRERDRERERGRYRKRGCDAPVACAPFFRENKNFHKGLWVIREFFFHAVSRRKGLLPCLLQGASNGGLATVNPLNYIGVQRVKLAIIARLDPKRVYMW